MAYTIEHATLLADQLTRLATFNLHQLVGQAANLDFWVDEVVHVLATIDAYPQRFRRLHAAQLAWVKGHGTKASPYCRQCGGACELDAKTPEPPRRIPSEQMEAARAQVRRALYQLLLRCYRARLLDGSDLKLACDRAGICAEDEDLELPVPDPNEVFP